MINPAGNIGIQANRAIQTLLNIPQIPVKKNGPQPQPSTPGGTSLPLPMPDVFSPGFIDCSEDDKVEAGTCGGDSCGGVVGVDGTGTGLAGAAGIFVEGSEAAEAGGSGCGGLMSGSSLGSLIVGTCGL